VADLALVLFSRGKIVMTVAILLKFLDEMHIQKGIFLPDIPYFLE
jgi:hypothetical protein